MAKQTAVAEKSTGKRKIEMPHLFWIMTGLLAFACVLTYIVPAGQFAVDAQGKIIGTQFEFLGEQTPIGPWQLLMMVLEGINQSSGVIWVVLISGAMTAVVMATGAVDELINWAVYKLRDKSDTILISIFFFLMVYLGGFGGTDALIAVLPIGVAFARKLKLDPITALGVTSFATMIGFGTGPTKQFVTQLLMEVPVYGAFFTMFISMNLYMIIGLLMVLAYIKKIRKDPTKSPMWSEGWRPEGTLTAEEEKLIATSAKVSWQSVLILIIFMMQYIVIVAWPFMGGDGSLLLNLMVALGLIVTVVSGLLGRFKLNKIGEEFDKGLQTLVFVGFVIGLARVMALVLDEGHIMHTIVYYFTLPLMDLPRSVASVAMTAVISVINLIIPSATSKAAILVPILKPISEALALDPNLAVQAFQYGDGFTNMISPFLGWTVGGCVLAGVPFPKWFKWVLPKVLIFIAIGLVIMFGLTVSGWTAF